MNEKTKKMLVLGPIAAIILILLIVIIIFIISALGKPSKKTAEKIVNAYITAMNEDDGEKAMEVTDAEGYIIFKEYGEKKFDKNYKKKKDYLKEYYEKNDIEDKEDAVNFLAKEFKNAYQYNSYEYSLKDKVTVEKSSKSKKLVVIKAKIKQKSTYSSDTSTYKFYVMKVGGKYKIVGVVK